MPQEKGRVQAGKWLQGFGSKEFWRSYFRGREVFQAVVAVQFSLLTMLILVICKTPANWHQKWLKSLAQVSSVQSCVSTTLGLARQKQWQEALLAVRTTPPKAWCFFNHFCFLVLVILIFLGSQESNKKGCLWLFNDEKFLYTEWYFLNQVENWWLDFYAL